METLNLWGRAIPYNTEELTYVPAITPYPARSDGCVVVFAGGGYAMKAEHEGPVICEWLNSLGVTAFNVDYRVAPYMHPTEASDALRAVRWVRHNADKYGVDTRKIAVMGFSAGAHMAGTASVHYDKDFYEPTDEIDSESARPDASILCYPVIDMLEYRHDGSRQNLIGETPLHADKEFMSLYKQVTTETPPAFLWHTAADNAVPVENTLLYASALSKVNVPFEVHIYPYGHHGLGLAHEEPHVAQWAQSLDKWLDLMSWK